jgi:cell wall assembly regulator SMI1
MHTRVRSHFSNGQFGQPCAAEHIARAEEALGVLLPEALLDLYRAFDGFRGPTNAQYLFPLFSCIDGGSSLCESTLFFRDWRMVDLSRFVFFGSSTADESWGISLNDPKKIIAYHHHMEDEYEVVGSDIFQVYLADEKKCQEA